MQKKRSGLQRARDLRRLVLTRDMPDEKKREGMMLALASERLYWRRVEREKTKVKT